ncbi:MAG: TetR/AcrR family transcriptional regulator [Ardenticatenaceae bacterium]|nr:TetR/AcrR family transcriptional regulator [Ardenticatenaceae bacterium]
MSSKRDQIIETTCQLIELQGYHATGLNQILAESGAPKGSLYHYFPDGKDELVEEAVNHTSGIIAARLQAGMAAFATAQEAIPAFLRDLAHYVELSGFQTGGPITAVALEAASTNERLNAACNQAYQSWRAIIEQKLLADGCEAGRAKRLAMMVIALIEGAIILSRSDRSTAPLLAAAAELEILLQ